MKILIIISLIPVIYAVLRAFHDSYISMGPWKTWAFIEAVFIDIVVTLLIHAAYDLNFWFIVVMMLLFGFLFWLFFDCIQGYIRTGNILYISNYGFDARMRKTFKYNKPFLFWKEPGAIRLILFKIGWITGLVLSLISLINTYGT